VLVEDERVGWKVDGHGTRDLTRVRTMLQKKANLVSKIQDRKLDIFTSKGNSLPLPRPPNSQTKSRMFSI
jgi:hypothetical protein